MVSPWALQVLVAVADRGSFSGAADELALTQPAVSRQIAGLERQLGVRLFRRLARGVVPTAAGDAAISHARGVLAQLASFEASVRAHAGTETGRLRLAAFASANTWLTPEAIHRFGQAHPKVEITLVQTDPMAVLDGVRRGRLDLALVTSWQLYVRPEVARTDPEAAELLDADDAVDLVPLADEELLVATSASSPLGRRDTVALRSLRNATWIEGAYPDCLGPLPQLTDALGRPPRVGFTCHDWIGKQALVARGMGVMLVPSLAAPAVHQGLRLLKPRPALPPRRLFAAVPKPPYRTPPVDAMLSILTSLVTTAAPTTTAPTATSPELPSV